ncbi:MAG: redoxin domain-containing protein [Desulfobacteraceae bacterium]|jgi:peroxiredoxin|nr:redoxin domain-containing protein [Desulfobacteraceae bacterium]
MTHHHLSIGDQAPDFILINQHEKKVTPMAIDGRRTLFSFHPLAWTTVCEIQMRTLELKNSTFDELEVIAYGISVDSAQSKKAWADAIGVTETNLLADFWPHGEVADKYGLFNKDKGISGRANVLIGRDHTIEWIREYELFQVPDIEEVIDIISKLKQ